MESQARDDRPGVVVTSPLLRTVRSFSYAGEGIAYLVRTQPNFRVHLLALLGVVGTAIAVGVSVLELAVLVLAIGLVLLAEAMNSALEALVDLASPAVHPLAKVAKDVSAAGVLLAAGAAAIVGCLILGPRLFALIAR
jgi:diacylglycerol kinase